MDHEDSSDTLHAFYDASQKAQNAVLEVQCHAGLSITELNTLKAVVRRYKTRTQNGCELVLRELNQIAVEKIDLPYSLAEKLEEAKVSYAEVITIHNEEVKDVKQRKAGGIWKVLGACCMTVLGVAICSNGPPRLARAIGTVTVAAVGAVTMVGTALGTVRLNQHIHEMNNLETTIREQQELLQRAKKDTEAIVTNGIKPLKDKVRQQQERLLAVAAVDAEDISTGKCVEDMEDIICDDFLTSLDTQLRELQSLSGTCDELCAMVNKAYQLYKEKPGFITQRVLRGEKLY